MLPIVLPLKFTALKKMRRRDNVPALVLLWKNFHHAYLPKISTTNVLTNASFYSRTYRTDTKIRLAFTELLTLFSEIIT